MALRACRLLGGDFFPDCRCAPFVVCFVWSISLSVVWCGASLGARCVVGCDRGRFGRSSAAGGGFGLQLTVSPSVSLFVRVFPVGASRCE